MHQHTTITFYILVLDFINLSNKEFNQMVLFHQVCPTQEVLLLNFIRFQVTVLISRLNLIQIKWNGIDNKEPTNFIAELRKWLS